MNYLGIDYGKSKIGLAIARDGVKVAIPFCIVSDVKDIKRVVDEEFIDEIVVGYPLSLTGEKGPQAREVDVFIQRLGKFGIPVSRQDERFSTRAAQSKGQDDSSAAALILQTYLDRI